MEFHEHMLKRVTQVVESNGLSHQIQPTVDAFTISITLATILYMTNMTSGQASSL